MTVKSRRIVVSLFSSAGSGHVITTKRLRNGPKLELMKYDPFSIFKLVLILVKMHVLHTEDKDFGNKLKK